MELSDQDELCLNVLLAAAPEAIRIDEASMTVHGLNERGEATVKLHPNYRDDPYLKRVRELLSTHALGSPGGYPAYLQRWTRMGQNLGDLDRLLLLGEPEAVVSVAYSPRLTDELARRAWWALPSADNARRMLERECVAQGGMGRALTRYLVEHLPFEADPHQIIDTVRIVLQPGLLDEPARLKLWNKGRHDNAYYVGFLERVPDALPEAAAARADWEAVRDATAPLAAGGNRYAAQLARTLSGAGQTFLAISAEVLQRPETQDVVRALLNALAGYFAPVGPDETAEAPLEEVLREAEGLLADEEGQPQELRQLVEALPRHRDEICAMLTLSRCGENVVAPVLSRTTAIGSLMRRKLEPVTALILQHIATLRGGQPRRRL